MAVLEAWQVTRSFRDGRGELPVLRGISLAVERGEVVALEGPSGSGKTTLLFVLGCLLTPGSGRVVIDGRTIDPRRSGRLTEVRRSAIGFVFQHANLFPALTATENVEYALNLRGVRGTAARREARRVLDELGLAARRHARPRDLSGGQCQRVAIARAVAGGAPILLADEPTAHLDWQTGEPILGFFRDLARREGRALLIVTHDVRVRTIADRVAHLREGRLVGDGVPIGPADGEAGV